jgi:YVTN family beta-propeller protein
MLASLYQGGDRAYFGEIIMARAFLLPTLLGMLMAALSGCSENISPSTNAANSSAPSGTLIIGNKGEDTVSFINLASGEEVIKLDTQKMPHEVAISPDGRLAAIVAYGGETVDIFDIKNVSLAQRINLSPNKRPHGIVWLADGRIMATTEGSDTLSIISNVQWCPPEGAVCELEKTRISSIPTGNKGSHMLAVNANGNRAYISNLQSKNVSVLDIIAGKKIADLDAGIEPEGIALTPNGKELWVAARGSNEVFVFDTDTLEQKANIKTGRFPIRIAISPDGKYAVTSDLADGAISVIDVDNKQVTRTITVSGNADNFQVTLIFSPNGKYLYLAETGTNTIAEIDFASGKTLRRINAGEDGDGLGISNVAITPIKAQ